MTKREECIEAIVNHTLDVMSDFTAAVALDAALKVLMEPDEEMIYAACDWLRDAMKASGVPLDRIPPGIAIAMLKVVAK